MNLDVEVKFGIKNSQKSSHAAGDQQSKADRLDACVLYLLFF